MGAPRVLILDGMNCFYRSFAVDPSLSGNGEHVGGMMGVMKQIQKLLREMETKDHSIEEIIVAWDGPGGSRKRQKMKKTYKEGRKPVVREGYNRVHGNEQMSNEQALENKAWQMSRLVEYLNIMPVKQIMIDNVEADDIISYCVQHKKYKDYQKIIISNDKDFMQLLKGKTVIYRPATNKYVNRNSVIEKYKIHPENMSVARAIVGDKSDNLPGVRGIGMKTVVKRFPELSGSKKVRLDHIFDKSKKPPRKLKAYDNILENKDKVKLNYKMMQLYTPYMSSNATEKIEEVIQEDNVGFSKIKFKKMVMEDKLPDYNWRGLRRKFFQMTVNSVNNIFSE